MYNAVQHPYNKEIQGVDIKKATIKSLFELLCIFNCRTPEWSSWTLTKMTWKLFAKMHKIQSRYAIIPFSTVIEKWNERKALDTGLNAHFFLDEDVVRDLYFIIFFDICSMFLANSISYPIEDEKAAQGNPVHQILYNRPDNRCLGNSQHSCSSMSPVSDLA